MFRASSSLALVIITATAAMALWPDCSNPVLSTSQVGVLGRKERLETTLRVAVDPLASKNFIIRGE
jgi:hypothetical protein